MNSDDATWRDVAMVMWGKMNSLYEECGVVPMGEPEIASDAYAVLTSGCAHSQWNMYLGPRNGVDASRRDFHAAAEALRVIAESMKSG